MTVIIGIQCADGGIVVAADSAATFVTQGGAPTAKQLTSKLSIIDNQVIFGHSGVVGMGQRLENTAKSSWNNGKLAKRFVPATAMHELRNRFWQDVLKDEVTVANESGPHLMQLARQIVQQSFLVALPPLKDSERPSLFHFLWQGTPEMLTEQLPCVALGGGQPQADPFLSFIRRVIWKDGAPVTIGDGIFAAAWTLRYVLETSPGGVGGPGQMMVLKPSEEGNSWIAEEISDVNLDIHFEAVTDIEKYISEYPSEFQPGDIEAEETNSITEAP